MESRDVLKIHGALRRYCTTRVLLGSTLEVQYLLNLPCIFNTSRDSMLYLLNTTSVSLLFSMINPLFRTQFLNSVMHRRDGSTRRKFFE